MVTLFTRKICAFFLVTILIMIFNVSFILGAVPDFSVDPVAGAPSPYYITCTHAAGWAYDSDCGSHAIQIDIWSFWDGYPNGAHYAGYCIANLPRGDLTGACPNSAGGAGYCAFDCGLDNSVTCPGGVSKDTTLTAIGVDGGCSNGGGNTGRGPYSPAPEFPPILGIIALILVVVGALAAPIIFKKR